MIDRVVLPNYDDLWLTVYGDQQLSGPVHRHMHRIVSRLLEPLDYQSVLDVGCGPGHNYPLLTRGRSPSQFGGIDISAAAIEQARESIAGGEFWQLDIQTGYVNRVWDLVYCALVLEHVHDDMAALRNLRKMVGKYLLVTTIAGNFKRYQAWETVVGHIRNYRPGELEQKLDSTGFKVQKSIYWGFPFYSPLARALQNLSKVGTGQFTKATRFLANALYWLYFLNSPHRGDLLIVLAKV